MGVIIHIKVMMHIIIGMIIVHNIIQKIKKEKMEKERKVKKEKMVKVKMVRERKVKKEKGKMIKIINKMIGMVMIGIILKVKEKERRAIMKRVKERVKVLFCKVLKCLKNGLVQKQQLLWIM